MTDPANANSFDPETFKTEILDALNRGFTARETKLNERLDKKLADMVGGLTQSFDGSIAKLKETMQPAPTEGAEGGAGKKGKGTRDDVEYASLQRQIEALRLEADASKRSADEQRARARAIELRKQTSDALARIGIKDADRQRIASGHLIDSEKRVVDGDGENAGRTLWREDDGTLVDLDTGLKGWAKGEEAKLFLPATGVRGAGVRPAPGTPNGQSIDQAQAVRNVFEALDRAL